ncbi:MAG: hypothetical protein WDN31_09010 [Hyphomicrobium sp.]
MSFRRAIAAFVLCAGVPAVAAAQESRQVEVGYAITYLGFTGFRIDFTARFDDQHYDVESHTFKEGLIKAVTIGYDGKNRAWGGFAPQSARPSGGSLSIMVAASRAPGWRNMAPTDRYRRRISRNGSRAPTRRSRRQARGLARSPVGRPLGRHGGRRGVRPDRGVERRQAAHRHHPEEDRHGVRGDGGRGGGARGDLLVCEIYTKRIAGEFDEAPAEAESKREEPMKVWFARFDDSTFRYPAKLEAKQSLGTVRGDILFFRERALSDSEKTAMLR